LRKDRGTARNRPTMEAMQGMRGDLLDVRDLRVVFHTYRGIIRALNGVELWLSRGEKLGVVGESGCGKSVTALSVMRLIEQPGEIIGGSIRFEDRQLLQLSEDQFNAVRGREIAMIFQEPVSALNPVMKVGVQIAENISKNQKHKSRKQIHEEVAKMLELVGLDSKRTADLYAHELSGGMAQRAMIAMALSCRPKLLIADEPTSALDVTIQIQILALLEDLVNKLQYAAILITHDMGVAAAFCDKIAVMYAGNTVEYSDTATIFNHPFHPYTRGLFRAVPKVGDTHELETIPGVVPDLVAPPSGCRFHPRCPHVMDICPEKFPPLIELAPGHHVACYLYAGEGKKDAN
jgi:peptide/nickel transport system ATP-binding protein